MTVSRASPVLRDAQACDAWTATREMFLTASEDDLGDTLDYVEALMKKHSDFETSLAAQEEKEKRSKTMHNDWYKKVRERK